MHREPCRYCRLPLATKEDVENETDETGLCWSIVDHCDVDPEDAIDAHLATIARLERELEQERQDRKQADLDTIRALGERNDARRQVQELIELGKEASDNLAEANSEIEKLQRQLDQALKLGFEAARIAKNRGRC